MKKTLGRGRYVLGDGLRDVIEYEQSDGTFIVLAYSRGKLMRVFLRNKNKGIATGIDTNGNTLHENIIY